MFKVSPPLKKRNGSGLAESDFEKAGEFNGQFTDVFTKTEHSQVPLLNRHSGIQRRCHKTSERFEPVESFKVLMSFIPESLRNWHLS